MSSSFQVRTLTRTDTQVFIGLLEDFLEEALHDDPYLNPADDLRVRVLNDVSHWLEDDEHALLGLEAQGRVIGFIDAQLSEWPPLYRSVREVFIRHLYVHPGFRRKGGASMLVKEVRVWAQAQGVQCMRLSVLHRNLSALAFWKAQGGQLWTSDVMIPLEEGHPHTLPSRQPMGFR